MQLNWRYHLCYSTHLFLVKTWHLLFPTMPIVWFGDLCVILEVAYVASSRDEERATEVW